MKPQSPPETQPSSAPSVPAKRPVNLGRLDASSPMPQFTPGEKVTVSFNPPSPVIKK